MSRPIKKFKEWYAKYGIMDDYLSSSRDYGNAKRIAWRAYKRGKADGRKELFE